MHLQAFTSFSLIALHWRDGAARPRYQAKTDGAMLSRRRSRGDAAALPDSGSAWHTVPCAGASTPKHST